MRRLVTTLGLVTTVAACYEIAGYDDFSFVAPVRGRLEESRIDKVDLLLVVDNSRGTAEKVEVLRETLAVFLRELVDPPCLDPDGNPTTQPGPTGSCSAGSARALAPVLDMHVGVITSSLGGHGADACSAMTVPDENLMAHLQVKNEAGEAVATYQSLGFLAWDPAAKRDPPGIATADELVDSLLDILDGVTSVGCGYEAQHEAWYRFLVEPEPHQSIEIVENSAMLVGIDQELLDQRAAFLRDDSLIAVVVLSDENDCSIRDGGTAYFSAQLKIPGSSANYHLPKPRAACADDPGSACCVSCGLPPGPGCDTSADACCLNPPDCTQIAILDEIDDQVNLRCFDQKRRFGIDFLWPIDRYSTGLRSPLVPDRIGNLVENPLLRGRDPGRVLLTTIVGVPWQDVARQTDTGEPDLDAGRDAAGAPVGGLMNAAELEAAGRWPVIVGDPPSYVPPSDPFMIESIEPRRGQNPVTGDSVEPPGSGFYASPINGHEYLVPNRNDLQYACIFPLETPVDCQPPSGSPPGSCECDGTGGDNPVCVSPEGNYGTVQYSAKAYPGIRHLQLARALGSQGVVGSSCWQQVTDPDELSYGYKAAFVGGIVGRLRGALSEQLCLGSPLLAAADGRVPCTLVEARRTEGGECNCEGGRRFVDESHQPLLDLAFADPLFAEEQWNCFCELLQAPSGFDLQACQSYVADPVVTLSGKPVDGWCYLDAGATPPLGDPLIVAGCPTDRRRYLRTVGAARPREDARLFLYCE